MLLNHTNYTLPAALKRKLIPNMFKTVAYVCTGEVERIVSLGMVIAVSNLLKTTTYVDVYLLWRSITTPNAKINFLISFLSPLVDSALLSNGVLLILNYEMKCRWWAFLTTTSKSVGSQPSLWWRMQQNTVWYALTERSRKVGQVHQI